MAEHWFKKFTPPWVGIYDVWLRIPGINLTEGLQEFVYIVLGFVVHDLVLAPAAADLRRLDDAELAADQQHRFRRERAALFASRFFPIFILFALPGGEAPAGRARFSARPRSCSSRFTRPNSPTAPGRFDSHVADCQCSSRSFCLVTMKTPCCAKRIGVWRKWRRTIAERDLRVHFRGRWEQRRNGGRLARVEPGRCTRARAAAFAKFRTTNRHHRRARTRGGRRRRLDGRRPAGSAGIDRANDRALARRIPCRLCRADGTRRRNRVQALEREAVLQSRESRLAGAHSAGHRRFSPDGSPGGGRSSAHAGARSFSARDGELGRLSPDARCLIGASRVSRARRNIRCSR